MDSLVESGWQVYTMLSKCAYACIYLVRLILVCGVVHRIGLLRPLRACGFRSGSISNIITALESLLFVCHMNGSSLNVFLSLYTYVLLARKLCLFLSLEVKAATDPFVSGDNVSTLFLTSATFNWRALGVSSSTKLSSSCLVSLTFSLKERTKHNTPEAQGKCIAWLLFYHSCVNFPLMMFSYRVFKFMGMQSSFPLPSWKVVSAQILFFFIIEDFVFYWGHRILHTKWLYKNVHSVHHEYATPFGLTSEYAHPAEILFLGFATFIGPALTGPHLITLWLWLVLRVIETVEAHCGYHFPWSPSNFLPLYGGADFHDYHHRLLYTKSGNYSSTFVYMDWIFGTDKGYRKLKALKET
ncbi:hypothetical protein HID58_062519 [Brassica napus]|uniref:Fatty acid hydroxylase domain-containing protein n=1 Tax=Brassica napus TaxID=3708 RepID=A0ABQ8A1W3_BRANA|nr:hypothetical protein HID58_062519 [Brassica napus]